VVGLNLSAGLRHINTFKNSWDYLKCFFFKRSEKSHWIYGATGAEIPDKKLREWRRASSSRYFVEDLIEFMVLLGAEIPDKTTRERRRASI